MKQNRETEEWNAVLLELGFRPEEAEKIEQLITSGETGQATLRLRRRKQTLLDLLHTSEKKVDLLDYLLYRLKKQNAGARIAPGSAAEKKGWEQKHGIDRKTDTDRRMG